MEFIEAGVLNLSAEDEVDVACFGVHQHASQSAAETQEEEKEDSVSREPQSADSGLDWPGKPAPRLRGHPVGREGSKMGKIPGCSNLNYSPMSLCRQEE